MQQAAFRNRWLPYLLLLPTLLILLVFLYYPSIDTVRLSFYRAAPNGLDLTYIGTANFTRLLDLQITTTNGFQIHGMYWLILARSLVFAFVIVTGGLLISLGIAVLANQKLRGIRIYRTLLIWPYAISPAIIGVIFLFMFSPIGVVTYVWNSIFHTRPNWLGDPLLTPMLIIIAAIWKNLGYNVIFYLAGLQNISTEVVEAASMDGANRWQRFWRIIFPLLSPFTLFLILTNLTYSFFDIFSTVDVLGGVGNDSTNVLIYNLYTDLRMNQATGLAAAQSVMLFILVAFITILQLRTERNRVYYGA